MEQKQKKKRAGIRRATNKKLRFTGWKVERSRTSLLERIIAERWIFENKEHFRGHGGLLQLLFSRQGEQFQYGYVRPRLIIDNRDAMVSATVLQWLGTNCGYGFLTECLRRAGVSLIDTDRLEVLRSREARPDEPLGGGVDDQYYCIHSQSGYELVAGSWFNYIQQFAYDKKKAPVSERRRKYLRSSWTSERRNDVLEKIARRKQFEERNRRARQWVEHYNSGVWC